MRSAGVELVAVPIRDQVSGEPPAFPAGRRHEIERSGALPLHDLQVRSMYLQCVDSRPAPIRQHPCKVRLPRRRHWAVRELVGGGRLADRGRVAHHAVGVDRSAAKMQSPGRCRQAECWVAAWACLQNSSVGGGRRVVLDDAVARSVRCLRASRVDLPRSPQRVDCAPRGYCTFVTRTDDGSIRNSC